MQQRFSLTCDCGALVLRDVGIGEAWVLLKEHEADCALLREDSDE